MRRLGLVIPLPAEARSLLGRRGWEKENSWSWRREPLAGGADLLAVISGPGQERAGAAASWLVGQGAACLGVVGVAGGLSPDLEPGALVLSAVDWDESDGGEGRWRCGSLANADQSLLSATAKTDLFTRSGALAADQESAAVAAVAMAAGLSCFALRAVCDPAERNVPAALAACLDPAGNPRLLYLLQTLAQQPALLSQVLLLRRDFATALTALKREWRPVAERFLTVSAER